jgi:hypothetical protein
MRLFFSGILISTSLLAGSFPTVDIENIHRHEGQFVRTCSFVAGVYLSKAKGKPLFLNIGGAYPNQLMTRVIWESSRDNFSYYSQELAYKSICVTGKVCMYKDRLSMNIKNENKILRY